MENKQAASIIPTINARRIGVYVAGLLIYAFAVCLMTRANVGVSPVTSIAYIFTYIAPLTLGTTQLIVNVMLVLVQVLWLRREFQTFQYLQLAASLLFSLFIDLLMPVAVLVSPPSLSIVGRILLFILSLAVMAVGLGIVAIADVVMLPGDGVAKTIAYKTGWPFGKGKVVNDCVCVAITCIISIGFLRRLEGIQVGTVVAALTLGNLVRIYMKHTQIKLAAWIKKDEV